MPFCSQCGSAIDGSFCAKCGASQGAPAPVPAPAPAASGQLEEHLASTLCYALGGLTGIAFLLLEPYNRNRNIRFHAFQSIFLNVAFLVFYYGVGILLPFGLRLVMAPFILLGSMGVWLYVMWRTYSKHRLVLPIIGPMAEKQL